MIGGAKGIGIGIDFGIPNQYCRATSKPYIEKDVLDSLRVVASAYGKSNDDADRSIVKNLVDASNPFIISNAAFKLNSGFGKYGMDFLEWKANSGMNFTSTKLTSTKPNLPGGWLTFRNVSGLISETKVKVSGAPRGFVFIGNNNGADDKFSVTINNGVYTIPEFTLSSASGFYINNNSGDWSNLVIEQIPSFEGAFVTDGIDDLIKSTKSATEMLDGSNEVTVVSMIHQIKTNDDTTRNNWFFTPVSYLENRVVKDKIGKTGIYGYTSTNVTNAQISDITPILGDKNDYTLYSKIEDGDRDYFTVEGFQNQGIWYVSSIAWYWTIIANKVLTTDEINQVIAYYNLDRTLNPDILCNTIKQGITNENHAEFGDKLIDFSGNGRDIQLNNIAWKGDSGIGKYETDFTTWTRSHFTDEVNFTPSKIEVTGILTTNSILINKKPTPIYNVEIHSPNKSIVVYYQYNDDTGVKRIALVDGINELPSANDSLFVTSDRLNSKGITITQIPSRAGALCLDGVNDFGKVTGMPIYKDYTFIIEREFLNETFLNQVCLVSKSKVASEIENGGAFIVDNISVNSIINPYSFYKTTSLPGFNTFDRQIVFQSKYKYLDKDIAAGTSTDTDTMWLGTIRDNDSRFFNGAIYSLMSFPYSMSEFLIERQLKKHKLGTLYPDMVEFRPIIKGGSIFKYLNVTTNEEIFAGDYIHVGDTIRFYVSGISGTANEVSSFTVNGVEGIPKGNNGDLFDAVVTKSPQKINITIDEYIRYEDIVQPYPVLLRFNDENGNEVSWGGKFRVGSTITRIGSAADSNLLPNIYNIFGLLLNDNQVTSSKVIVEKTMVFKAKSAYIFDNNEPKCILSPSRLRIPNSSYKLLGYIPDISGHGNHGVIHNSAYAEGSGVNEDGSYQFDGVDDFVTIPTVTGGGKQVLMKVNDNTINSMLYDQRSSGASSNSLYNDFAIYCTNSADNNQIAYQSRLVGNTYIDGILNTNITCEDLLGVLHNITITCDIVAPNNGVVPNIGRGGVLKDLYSKVALYDFMLFDSISTDDKIKELNEYVGIEAKVELPPYYRDAYGKTNLDADKATIQQRGVAEGDYDITNYNHAYDKMSGYGGYEFAKFDNVLDWYLTPNNNHIDVVSRNGYEITLKNLSTSVYGWYFQNSRVIGFITRDIPFKVKANKSIRVYWDMHSYKISSGEAFGHVVSITTLNPNEDTSISLRHLTEEELVELDTNKDRMYYLLWFDLSTLAVDEEVTIEMLPLYPNGLVYDGVTDYSENANIPAFTDFTYILKRQILKGIANSAVMYKGNITVNQGGAFICNYCEPSDTNLFTDFSFGGLLRSNDIDKPIIYGTKTSVNGDSITPGENIDTVGINVGKWVNYLPMVLYKLILYPKTIPLLQINFLKNLMERDEIIDLDNPIFIQ